MNAWAIIGWAYDADLHCDSCTRARFPEANREIENVTDSEGNAVHPVFVSDEHAPEGEYCGDCGAELWEPDTSMEDA
jgi:hypothetical protein